MRLTILLVLLQFARPATALSANRRGFVTESAAVAAAAFAAGSLPAFAEEAAAPAKAAKVSYGDFPVPETWGIGGKDYYADAALVVAHMEYATQVQRSFGACLFFMCPFEGSAFQGIGACVLG